jgi:hypothetical protein
MPGTPHDKRERQRKRDERRLEKLLRILSRPSAAVLPDVEVWKALTIKQLEAVRDPEAYRAWNTREIRNPRVPGRRRRIAADSNTATPEPT